MKTFNLGLLLLALAIFIIPACEEWEEIPGKRVPLGSVSSDFWEQVRFTLESPEYLASADGVLLLGSGNKLLLSTDDGRSWEEILTAQITSVGVDEADPGRIWVTTPSGIFISKDGGDNFTQYSTPDELAAVVPHVLLTDHLYAISDTAVFRSSDRGQTWEHLFTPPSQPSFTHLAVDRTDSSYLYLIDGGALRVSTDGGKRWESRKYFGSQEDTVHFTHLKTTPQGLWMAAGGAIRFSPSHGLGEEDWLSYAPLISLDDYSFADFEVVSPSTIMFAAYSYPAGEYHAYLTHDLGNNWASASEGLIGYQGEVILASSDTQFYALISSSPGEFLYKFKDTELAP